MKKISFLLLLMLLFSVLSCRNENFYSESTSAQNRKFSYRIVDKKDIPGIINFVSVKTDNFKVPLKQTTALNKTETAFGEVNTDYIIEAINEKNETYYVFSIIPSVESGSDVYNLEVRSEGDAPQTAKIMVYLPSEDWVLNGNGNFSVFSGKVKVYSEDGDLESSTSYLNGAGDCNDDPCPDCPPGPANPPGNPGNGNGGNGGPPPPGGGNPPTGTGRPISYPDPGSPGNPAPGDPGTTSGGLPCYWKCIFDENGDCTMMECIEVINPSRLMDPCSGSGMVNQAPQKTPCEKAKTPTLNSTTILKNPEVQSKMDAVLKSKINAANEYAVSVGKNSNGTYSVSPPNEGGATEGTVPPVVSGLYVADGHSHTNGNFGVPSPGDFYNFILQFPANPYLASRFVYGSYFGEAEVYALVIYNKTLAQNFINNYPKGQNYNETTHSFSVGSSVGDEYFMAMDFASGGTYIDNTDENYSPSAMALAYVLGKFNTGISLAKVDANGNLKAISVTKETIVIPGGTGTPKPGLKVVQCP